MKWITAGDIKNWLTSNQRHCAQTLPELIRRLILATATKVEKVEFQTGDSIAHAGWDGHLKTPDSTPFFPDGTSAWEIGTEDSPGKKAEEDYTKRTADPLGFVQHDTSFIFVTPRPWPRHVEWENEKRATGVWKDVRVIAADALEQWLDLAPAVALWLGRQIKGLSDSLRDLEWFWEEWSAATAPKLTIDTVIGGRTKELERVHQWLRGPASILELRGDSPDEPLAFLYGAIAALPELERLRALSRCVMVENVQEFRSCAAIFRDSLILVAPAECREAAGFAVDREHRVFLSADPRSVSFRDNLIELSRPRREMIEKGLAGSGVPEAEARQLSRDFGRSMPVLRRHLFRSSARTPSWAEANAAPLLIPLLLAEAWDEREEGDCSVIECLSGMTHQEYVAALMPFLSIEDSPIRKIGTVWMLKSPLDAWFLLSPHLTETQLKLFDRSILSVLTKTDPKYDLEPEKRWMAALYGKSNPFSDWIRTGLVESLILIAIYGDESPHIWSTQAFANHVVKEILTSADKWEAWASIKDVSPLLGEAAPEAFMDALEQGLAANPEMFAELMSDDGGFFDECRYSGLLWALEGIAWSPDYFPRATQLLFALSTIDKGGKWGNRPINTLKDIFLAGFPQTNATAEQRLAAWDSLVEKDPAHLWTFAHKYYRDDSISESHQFRWRDKGGNRGGLEPEDPESHQKYSAGILSRLRELASRRENLTESIRHFNSFPKDVQEKLSSVLEAAPLDSFTTEERAKIRYDLREVLNWVNTFGDNDQRQQIPALWRVYERFTPTNPIERDAWLFTESWPELPEGEPKDFDARGMQLTAVRHKAAREILDHEPLDRVLDFAAELPSGWILGLAIGRVVHDTAEDTKLLNAMIPFAEKCQSLISGYAASRAANLGPEWIDQQVARTKREGNYTPQMCASLYFGREENAETWAAVASQGKEVENIYWKTASGYSRETRKEDSPIAVEKLLEAKRPGAALRIAGSPDVFVPSALLRQLLQELLVTEDRESPHRNMMEFHLGHVFNQLYKQNELQLEELAHLEWPFAELFRDIAKRYTKAPMALHRLLQKDPSFFAQLISFVCGRQDNQPDASTEGIDQTVVKKRAHIAYEVLKSWHLLPGLKDDGTVDGKALIDWISQARKQCAEINRVAGGDIYIGFALAHAPGDPDGAWPHQCVRNVLEHLANKTIEDHIRNELYNRRGVVMRAIGAGGNQERDLGDSYKAMSEKLKAKWPRTSALLRSMSETYHGQAKREDIDSDLEDFRWM